MMPAAERHPSLIGHRHDVVRMDALEKKADQTRASNGWSKKANVLHGRELFEGVGAQFLIMMSDAFAADTVQIIHGDVQTDGARDVRSAGFEAMRRGFPGASMIIDRKDHLPTTPVWGRLFEALATTIENAEAGRAAHFMAGKNKKIAADLLHIERTMSSALVGGDQRDHSADSGA